MDLRRCRLLVTPTSYGNNDGRLRTHLEAAVAKVTYNPKGTPLTSAEVSQLLPGVDGYIAGLDAIDRAALAGADRLRVIARYGTGVDNIDLEAARQKGITVTNTPGANAASVAELTMALILAVARRIPEAVTATHEGRWPRLSGKSLEAKTVGIIGLGAIGKHLARRLEGFDCRIVVCDPHANEEFARLHHIDLLSLNELLRQSDFVSLNLPLTPETQGMVDRGFLSTMKAGACLVNTSRGEIIDEGALLAALMEGHLSGAALDVFSEEPPDPSHALLALPQVIATPHIGAQTDGATNNMGWMALEDCLAVLRGEEPHNRVV